MQNENCWFNNGIRTTTARDAKDKTRQEVEVQPGIWMIPPPGNGNAANSARRGGRGRGRGRVHG